MTSDDRYQPKPYARKLYRHLERERARLLEEELQHVRERNARRSAAEDAAKGRQD